jgi:predicted transcriptional regulator
MTIETDARNFTLRMPDELRETLTEIAGETSRSLSSVAILLMRRGIAAYRSDGVLVDTRAKNSLSAAPEAKKKGKK